MRIADRSPHSKCSIQRLKQGRVAEWLEQEFNGSLLEYPLQRELVRNLAIAAEAAGRADLVPLCAGQSANLSTCTDVSAFLSSLVEEVSEIAGPVIQWSANHSRSTREPGKEK